MRIEINETNKEILKQLFTVDTIRFFGVFLIMPIINGIIVVLFYNAIFKGHTQKKYYVISFIAGMILGVMFSIIGMIMLRFLLNSDTFKKSIKNATEGYKETFEELKANIEEQEHMKYNNAENEQVHKENEKISRNKEQGWMSNN